MSNGPQKVVRAIYGHEPHREGEYPVAHAVGAPLRGSTAGIVVDAIKYREDNYGDHGLGWYDIVANDQIALSISARAVAEIHYA